MSKIYKWRRYMQLSNDIKQMNMTDKFILLEQYADDDRFTPQWHLDILNEIENKEKNGELEFSNFDDAKKRLRSLVTK